MKYGTELNNNAGQYMSQAWQHLACPRIFLASFLSLSQVGES